MESQTRRNFLESLVHPPPGSEEWQHIYRKAMACRFEVTLPLSDAVGVGLATEVLDEVDRLEAQLTIFRETSEVSNVNRVAAESPVRISQSLFDLLVLCKDLHRETDGAFDITSTPLTRCWGFLRRAGRLPDQLEIQKARVVVGSDNLLLDCDSRTVRFAKAGVEINLGSIGKGYALDCAASSIEHRVRAALLSAGSSSFRALGRGGQGQTGWAIGLRDPARLSRRLGVLKLQDCAMSTSGSEEQFFEHAGRRYGHIIDPRSGWPAESVTSVTVVAQSAAITDALATAFYVGGHELAERYCASHPQVLVILLESGSTTPVVIGENSGARAQFDA
jgi:thiamine biosynthesis lipoprotein